MEKSAIEKRIAELEAQLKEIPAVENKDGLDEKDLLVKLTNQATLLIEKRDQANTEKEKTGAKAEAEQSSPDPETTTSTEEMPEEPAGEKDTEAPEALEEDLERKKMIAEKKATLENIDAKILEIEKRLTTLDKKTDKINQKISIEQKKIEKILAHIEKVEEKIATLTPAENIKDNQIKIEEKQIENLDKEAIPEKEGPADQKTEDKISPEKIEPEQDAPTETTKDAQEIEETTEKPTENLVDQEIEKALTQEEITILEEEMKTAPVETFESEEVKTNRKTFFKNQIVKYFSGIKVPPKIEKIINKSKRGFLIGVAVLTFFGGISSKAEGKEELNKNIKVSYLSFEEIHKKSPETIDFFDALNIKNEKELEEIKKILKLDGKEEINETIKNFDLETYKQLVSKNSKLIYLYSLTNEDSAYAIVDKPTASMQIIGKNKKLIATFPILLGKTKGEMRNQAIPGGPNPYMATTPAKKYTIGSNDVLTKTGNKNYDEKTYILEGTYNPETNTYICIHITAPRDLKNRTIALNTPTPLDNRKSSGCLNADETMWDSYIVGNIGIGCNIYITPDNINHTLNPGTNQIEYTSSATNFIN